MDGVAWMDPLTIHLNDQGMRGPSSVQSRPLSPGPSVCKRLGGDCVPQSDSFPSQDPDPGNARLSRQVSNAITCFARYPDKRPIGLCCAADGSLDIHQVWLHWGRRMNHSRHQLLQFISENAFGSGGRRRFLLSSDTDG